MDEHEKSNFYAWLRQEVTRLGFDLRETRIGRDGSIGDGELGFEYRDGKWVVYVFERGSESRMAVFDVRREAVYFFFLKLMQMKGKKSYPAINFGSLFF